MGLRFITPYTSNLSSCLVCHCNLLRRLWFFLIRTWDCRHWVQDTFNRCVHCFGDVVIFWSCAQAVCGKPGSQYYDAGASLASQALRWHWNGLDFYSSVALSALANVQPIRLSKNERQEYNLTSEKILFPWRSRCSWHSQCQHHIVNQAELCPCCCSLVIVS